MSELSRSDFRSGKPQTYAKRSIIRALVTGLVYGVVVFLIYDNIPRTAVLTVPFVGLVALSYLMVNLFSDINSLIEDRFMEYERMSVDAKTDSQDVQDVEVQPSVASDDSSMKITVENTSDDLNTALSESSVINEYRFDGDQVLIDSIDGNNMDALSVVRDNATVKGFSTE